MSHSSIRNRIKAIQSHVGVSPDGVIGPATLTALEAALFKDVPEDLSQLRVSEKGVDLIISHEVSSKSYYQRFLSSPVWPGGGSGVTIGVGYDLGYNPPDQIRMDWGRFVGPQDLQDLMAVSGKKGKAAQDLVAGLARIRIPYEAASEVFFQSTLGRFAQRLRAAYPGVEALFPDAQAGLLSLVYNRGTAMAGDRRQEMAAIKPLVAAQDYPGIAGQILAMKRLWEGKNLDGLLRRREEEARLVLESDRSYQPEEIIRI